MMLSNKSLVSSSSTLLFLGCLCFTGVLDVTAQEDISGCDFVPDALANAYGRDIRHSCIDVPSSDDGSTTTVEERCYYSYVPESCINNGDPEIMKVPLVLDIHQLGSCPLFSAGYTGWMEKAEEVCFVMMWPSGKNDGSSPAGPCFNVPGFLKDDDNDVTTMPCCCLDGSGLPMTESGDTPFLKMAIDTMVETLETNNDGPVVIDTDRVYMAGHSNGCMTSLAMAARYSDTIAAVCCHSGAVLTPFNEDYTPVPIWMAHGVQDEIVPYNGATMLTVPGIGALGFWSVDQTIDYLASKNECSEVKETNIVDDSNENEIIGTVFKRTNCKQNANVEVVTLFEGDHYPYKPPSEFAKYFEDQNTKGLSIDTTTLAWEFCSSHIKGVVPTPKPETQTQTASPMEEIVAVDIEQVEESESEDTDAFPTESAAPQLRNKEGIFSTPLTMLLMSIALALL